MVTKEQAPEWCVDNEYILSGYRTRFSLPLCIHSVVRLHNETGNIWSHLIAFVVFFLLLFHVLEAVSKTGSFVDKLLWTTFVLSAQGCWLVSSVYHTFSCHSYTACALVANLDYSGISTHICCSWMLLANYLFYCEPLTKFCYVTTVASFCIVRLLFPSLGARSRTGRMLLFPAMALFGIVPMVHWILLRGYTSNVVQLFWWRFPLDWGIFSIGFVAYATRFPERLAPGKFDIWFHSHQWWHVFVSLGAYYFYHIHRDFVRFYEAQQCSPFHL